MPSDRPSSAEVNALTAKVGRPDPPPFAGPGPRGERVWQTTQAFYAARQFRPVWIAGGKTTNRFAEFLQLIEDRSHGLHPEQFGADRLRRASLEDPAEFDIRVTVTLVRYAAAIANGYAAPSDIARTLSTGMWIVRLHEILIQEIDAGRLSRLGDRLAPNHPEYAALRAALKEQIAQREAAVAAKAGRAAIAMIDERIQRIEANLDRWRWLPDELGPRHVRVNIPAFELEIHEGGEVPLRTRVVVGTQKNRTPIFSDEITHVVFSPYWNIPDSIAAKETLPMIMKDPDYAFRQNIEVIRVADGVAQTVDPEYVDWSNVDAAGLQLRQKPGRHNALGLVKFAFPNRFNVYLHDTPAGNLFDRLTRTFSHGCIRVQHAEQLASFALRDQPEWTADRIQHAMRSGREQHVALKEKLPVHIVYFTVVVNEDGSLQFLKDVYGYDAIHVKILRDHSAFASFVF